jgi:hypothetical protein
MIDRIKQLVELVDLLCGGVGNCRVQRVDDGDILAAMSYGKVHLKVGPIEAAAPCGGFTFKRSDDCYAWRSLAESAVGSISFGDDRSIVMDYGFMVIYAGDGKYSMSMISDNQWFDVYAQIAPCPRFIDLFSMPLRELASFQGKIDLRMKERDAELAIKPDVAWARVNGVRVSVCRDRWRATEKSVRDLAELARRASESL